MLLKAINITFPLKSYRHEHCMGSTMTYYIDLDRDIDVTFHGYEEIKHKKCILPGIVVHPQYEKSFGWATSTAVIGCRAFPKQQ